MQIRLRDGAMYSYCSEHSISRDELARRMGVTSTTAYRVERGDVDPSPRFIAALMHTTGKRFEQLFDIVPAQAHTTKTVLIPEQTHSITDAADINRLSPDPTHRAIKTTEGEP